MYYKLKQSNELCHYGTKGQRWGDRKYQYEDGSLTPEGKIRYGVGNGRKGSSFKPSNTSNKRYNGNSYKKSNVKKNRSNVPSKKVKKPDLSKYNTNKKVKDIKKDQRTFTEKANDFLASPLGKAATSLTITAFSIIAGTVFKEAIKGAFGKGPNKQGFIDEQDQKSDAHIAKVLKVDPTKLTNAYTEANKLYSQVTNKSDDDPGKQFWKDLDEAKKKK